MNVKFKYGTLAAYQSIANPDADTLYFITDKGLVYKGPVLVTNKITVEAIDGGHTPAHLRITDSSTNNTFQVYSRQQVDALLATVVSSADAMVFKGTIGAAANSPTVTALPQQHEVGWTYRVVTAGTYEGHTCEVGDLIICVKDTPEIIPDGENPLRNDWTVAQTNIDGAVTAVAANLTDGCLVLGAGGRGVKFLANGNAKQILTIDPTTELPVWENFPIHGHSTNEITSGTLPVARGGTGLANLTAGRALIGNGTYPVSLREIDTQPAANSDHLITSGAVAAAIAAATLVWEQLQQPAE